jgi:hypothetical protein
MLFNHHSSGGGESGRIPFKNHIVNSTQMNFHKGKNGPSGSGAGINE